MIKTRVRCPRCSRVWWAYAGDSDVQCNCHEYCVDGDKPQDCTLVAASSGSIDPWTGNWNWPQGIHITDTHEGADVRARIKYCTTHDNYVNKVPLLVPVDWTKRKLIKKLQWYKGLIR